jgi:N-acetylglucosaminyldiphosphoundecaprenol N-acetyl-beta-D-mannosaminyltransferase
MSGGIAYRVKEKMPRLNVMGVGVSAVNMAGAIDTFAGWIERGERRYVCALNAHSIVEAAQDPVLQRIHNRAGLATPDGMPLVWLLKAAGHSAAGRVCGPDLMLAVMEDGCRRGYRHFLYGSTPETLRRLEANLLRRFPELRLVGSHSPPFRQLTTDEEEDALAMINASGADIVWVGLGAPKQERWMAANRPRLEPPILAGVGAAFDFHAGTVRQAPTVLQHSGLEWLFRLCVEPRRLWRRYLTTNPRFVVGVLLQRTGIRGFELDA